MASKKTVPSDDRFSRVSKDPRFWEMPEKDKKIKIDKRFRSMFHDQKFNLKYTVDKRGRPINHSTTEDLKRYYNLSDTDEEELSDEKETPGKQKAKTKLKKKPEAEKAKSKKEIKKKDDCKNKNILQADESNNNVEDQRFKGKSGKLTKDISEEKDELLKSKKKSTVNISQKSNKKSVKKITIIQPQDGSEEEEESGESDEDDSQSDDEDNMEYELDQGSEEVSEEEEEDSENEESEDDEESGSGEEEGVEEDSDSGPDLARGKGNVETSSEDEDDDEEEVEMLQKDNEIEHAWREMDKDAPRGAEVTRRLAVCNMDWDRLKAKDLLALFNSFKPKGGVIFSVKIYPSEFGKERLKEESLKGPVELKNITDDDAAEKGAFKEKLREYQFKRLRYYYAVVDCDTPETANKIYEECDGLEFESSCSFVDLRFVPDDEQFNDEPKESASDVELASYKPKFFTSAAMATSKVDLTWDETDHDRITAMNRPFKKNEILDMDFQAYLASSSEEEEEDVPEVEAPEIGEDTKTKKGAKDDEEQIARYRELVKSIQDKDKAREDKDMEMEVKWIPGLKESAEKMVKKKLHDMDQLTPWEQYLQKRKDKRKIKRKQDKVEKEDEGSEEEEVPSDVDMNDPYFSEEMKKPGIKKKDKQEKEDSSDEETEKEKQRTELSLLMMDDVEDERKHFNYDQIVEQQNLSKKKKKQLKKKEGLLEDDFQINVEDTRFQALYTSHLYNVDPSDPSFKKTKAMEKVLVEKARRREHEQKSHTETVKRREQELVEQKKKGTTVGKSADPALSMLLKSVKNKTQQFQASKKQKTK
ncbi:ESF1 homolog [Discoglossus pictus]